MSDFDRATAGTGATPGLVSSCANRIELHIEELVLPGFVSHERHRIVLAAERELTRLLTEGEEPPSVARGGAVAYVDGGSFEVKIGSFAEHVGAQIAQAVYRG
jgi:hypothetical protein